MLTMDSVKLKMRIKTTAFDAELADLITECKADLSLAGINVIDDSDPLIEKAVVTYCKANFGLNNPNSEKMRACYDLVKIQLANSTKHTEVKL